MGTEKSPAWSGLFLFAALCCAIPASGLADGDPKRGAYLAKAGGCAGCHTEEKKGAVPYAGGRELKTPFGNFFGPNITPHAEAGIGHWSEADFMRALRSGLRPDGAHYYPAFPYASFTGITDADARHLWAYFRSLAPDSRASRPHKLSFPFNLRYLVRFWKWLYFSPGPFVAAARTPTLKRGAYLAGALGHCGECHTPRNFLGGLKRDRLLAGTAKGADGKSVPNLTPAKLKKWDDGELKEFLVVGITPDGDVPAETMGEVIRNTTSQLIPEDLSALIAYLLSLPALADEPR